MIINKLFSRKKFWFCILLYCFAKSLVIGFSLIFWYQQFSVLIQFRWEEGKGGGLISDPVLGWFIAYAMANHKFGT